MTKTIPNATLAPESYDEKFDRMKKKKEALSAEQFMEKQFADHEIKAVYERLAKK